MWKLPGTKFYLGKQIQQITTFITCDYSEYIKPMMYII